MAAGGLPTGIQEALADFFPDCRLTVEAHRIGVLYLNRPSAALTANSEDMPGNFRQLHRMKRRPRWFRTGIGNWIPQYGFPILLAHRIARTFSQPAGRPAEGSPFFYLLR